MTKRLQAMLDEFLKERRKSVGGEWGYPIKGDTEKLSEIIAELVKLKFAQDYQGESAVGFFVYNKREGHAIFSIVPHSHLENGLSLKTLRSLAINAESVLEQLRIKIDHLLHDEQNKAKHD